MKIGFDAKRAFFNNSGLGNYSRTLITRLCELYPENEYFLFSPKNNPARENFPPPNANLVFPQAFPYKQFPSYWRSFKMGKDISSLDIGIFHGLSNELPADIRRSNARSVVTIHDLIFMRYPGLYKPADRAIYRKKFENGCRSADAVIAISEQTKNDIVEYLGIDSGKIHVIYQGCDPVYYRLLDENFRSQVREKHSLPDEFMLYVGTIEERKNLLQLVRAKHEHGISLPLVVIGRATPYFEKVRQYISQNQVSGVIFLKNLHQDDLPAIYQSAGLFVYPSSFEGFGIPVLEALNSGTPVIAGTGSCLEEAGGSHSLYVNPMDPGEIAKAVNNILKSPETKKRMRDEGFKHALLFREDNTVKEVMNLYRKLL